MSLCVPEITPRHYKPSDGVQKSRGFNKCATCENPRDGQNKKWIQQFEHFWHDVPNWMEMATNKNEWENLCESFTNT